MKLDYSINKSDKTLFDFSPEDDLLRIQFLLIGRLRH